jgi:aminoglycoside phosphotransferase family enzyme/predicted kinase
MSADRTDEIAAAMAQPAFYEDSPASVEVRETHISRVFLAGDLAFKLRKPVVLPFLDYGTAERRRHMCEEELRLGRRLAPDLYRGLRSVVERADGFALAEADAAGALEPVVEMRRFDEADTLAARIERGAAGERDVRALARLVADFHARAEPAPPGSFGPAQVAATVSENFTTLLAFAEQLGDPRLAAAHRFAVAFLHGQERSLSARVAAGCVRDCHGDLRAEHVLFEGDRIEVFDPVEFDPGLRLIDVAADLAFVVMELAEAGREDLAAALVDEYRAAGGDDGGDALLAFYAAYRAWVRAKIACLRGEWDHARALAGLAEGLSWRARRPLVLIVCGAAATGKTHLARMLAGDGGLPHLSSDVVRKRLAGIEPTQRAPLAEYSEQASLRVYEELGARAARAAADGGAVVDATFRRRADRDAFRAAYGAAGPAPLYVQCVAPAEVVAERSRRRELEPERSSDATAEIALRQLAELEPLDEVPADLHVTLRTDRSAREVVDDVEAALDARLARSGR